jgi:hypothetical protein
MEQRQQQYECLAHAGAVRRERQGWQASQLVYYEVGVNGFLGGVFGKGLDDNIRLAYEWLVENYSDGDEIFIFGFSQFPFAGIERRSDPDRTSRTSRVLSAIGA